MKSAPLVEGKTVDAANSVAQNSHSNTKERGKSTSQTLLYNNVGYRMVNGLVLSLSNFSTLSLCSVLVGYPLLCLCYCEGVESIAVTHLLYDLHV